MVGRDQGLNSNRSERRRHAWSLPRLWQGTWSLSTLLRAGLTVGLTLTATLSAAGVTKLEGDYQLTVDARKTQRSFEWDNDYNHPETWTGAQFRLFTSPFAGAEAFLRFEADWNDRNNSRRPVFQYRESHLGYKWERPTWNAEARVFQRQDRYWVERHLIEIISPGNLTDGGNSQGLRVDLRGWGDTEANFILSDYSGQSQPNTGAQQGVPVGTDDAKVFRLRRKFLNDRMRLGFTYGRRNDREDTQADIGDKFQEVWAGDFRIKLGQDVSFFLEYADSRSRGAVQHEGGSFFATGKGFNLRRPDQWAPTDSELRVELRTLRLGNGSTGFYNLVPMAWYIGRGYVNPLENFNNNPFGNGGSDEQGFFLNSWYLVPARAITLTVNLAARERRFFEKRETRQFYSELYMEYVNGFTSKLSYFDKWDRVRSDRGILLTINRDVFAEVQVETRLAWMRVQGKIKDINTEFQKELASLETSVNLTPHLKLYSRYTFGNDPTRLRKGIFSQLQYRPRGNMEVFLAYGPSWIGDTPNPVDDGDLSGSGEQEEMLKLTIKGTF